MPENTPPSAPFFRTNTLLPWLMLVTTLLILSAYHAPWHLHEVAAFANNAFDLAEWVSLHPFVRNENPPLHTSWLLRLPLVLLGMVIALAASRLNDPRVRWLWRLVAVLVVLRLNPPIDYFTEPEVSLNEEQLGDMMLGGLAGVGVIILLSRWLKVIYPWLILLLCAVMLDTAHSGYDRATDIVSQLAIETDTGGGYDLFILFVYVLGTLAALQGVLDVRCWLRAYWQRRQSSAAEKSTPVTALS
jgi:hypothetical protein